MEMPDNKNRAKIESLSKTLRDIYKPTDDSTFDELLKKCDESSFERTLALDSANERITRILNSNKNA